MRGFITTLGLLAAIALAACHEQTAPQDTTETQRPPAGTTTQEQGPIPVEVTFEGGRYRLLRGGEPYVIKGAGIDRPSGVDPDGADLVRFAGHGGNSFRNWRDQSPGDGLAILDEAARHGMTVAMSIPVGRERLGFDYDDEEAVAEQMAYARSEVLQFRNHPALLLWVIGNEINLESTNPKVFDAVNDIARMIHELDPDHPVTTTLAGFDTNLANLVEERMPDLDIISVQLYGDLVNLPRKLGEANLSRPVLVTEWGARGHWEVEKTSWGAPIEMNSSAKARNYLRGHQDAIASVPEQIIGSFVFVWGQKQERTPTWYGMFLEDGSETEAIDVMHWIWSGKWPDNRAPGIEGMWLDGRTANDNVVLLPGATYRATASVADPDGDPLTFTWEIMRESEATQVGGDKEDVPETIAGRIQEPPGEEVMLAAPEEAGAYRLFLYVRDGHGNAGHANIPFLVGSQ